MPRFSGKQADIGVPVTIDRDRYVEGDVDATIEGNAALGEKPGNVVFPIQLDASGYLKINMVAGGYSEHEYQDGASSVASYGHLIMGDDGANLQNITVDAQGHLQVDVLTGAYDGVQYQDGAAVASPFGYVALGHDGSNVFPVVVDASGYLQVDIRNLPADTFSAEGSALGKGVLIQGDDGIDRQNLTVVSGRAHVDVLAMPGETFEVEGNALGKGVLIQGDDGTDRHNVAVDASGNVQVDIIDEPKADILNSIADVTLAATATTQILGALVTRLCALISNKKANTQTFRIGDSNAGATRGVELAPGQSISLETTEAIHGYNPGGSGEAVSVIWTED